MQASNQAKYVEFGYKAYWVYRSRIKEKNWKIMN